MIIHKGIVELNLPHLLLITALTAWQLRDGLLSLNDELLIWALLVVVLAIQIVMSLGEGSSNTLDKIMDGAVTTANCQTVIY
ncbi:hypothetical protein [Psychrobacter sp. ANT_WB68]|uniref:hypothetical protein n=1 Tax=Psychrobacter sp. ANT_WB68 TaxID=2597355 RepID=UPI0011F158DA|nr:hypothetical protein [Psychrobacter sp. ANT_WB68]KAA0913577.1 hypothetical protein FQ084_09780 [Psychrobacter sp. ANT_WB68]